MDKFSLVEEMDKIIFNIPKNLKKEFQIKVISDGKDMTEVLNVLVRDYLDKK